MDVFCWTQTLACSQWGGGGVLNHIQEDREVVIAYASRSLRLSQRRYEILVAVVMCTHFRSYLRGAQFTLRTDHSSLRWLQKFRYEDGMLARWYLLLGQFSVTFEYRPGAEHANDDGMSRQCGQCQRPDCPVSSSHVAELDTSSVLLDQPFARNGRFHGRRLAAGTVRGDLGGSHVIGGTYGGLASGGIGD